MSDFKTMAVAVPTRSRPSNAARLHQAFYNTVVGDTGTHLYFYVDDDDPDLEGYRGRSLGVVFQGPRLRMGPTLRRASFDLAKHNDIVGFMGDDHLPRTVDWDKRIKDAMVPGGIVYANDLFQGENLPTAVFIDSAVVRALEGMVPEGFTHLYLDNTWKFWGEQAGTLRYLPDVIIEHMHPHAGKAEADDQYSEVNSSEMYSADSRRYNEYVTSGEAAHDASVIRTIADNGSKGQS